MVRAAVGTLVARQRTLLVRELCQREDLTFLDRLQFNRQLWELAEAEQRGAFDWPAQVEYPDCTSGPFSEAREVEIEWESVDRAPTEALVNALSMMSPYGLREKQALLEAPDLRTRAELLIAITEIELAGKDGESDITVQ